MPDGNFQFVVGDRPDQLKASSAPKVKSHLAKRGWAAYRASSREHSKTGRQTTIPGAPFSETRRHDGESRRPRRRNERVAITFEWACCPGEEEDPRITGFHDIAPISPQSSADGLSPLPPIEYQLGGGRIDPFHTHPGQRRPYVPALIDHYIVHMAVDIPELDQPGSRGLLRSSWFPLALSEPACFAAIMLLSASNFASANHLTGLADQLLRLKASAIDLINQDLSSGDGSGNGGGGGGGERWLSDGMIGAVAKMASFEAMHGDAESYTVHMQGLRRMVDLRGGMGSLGLDGLLRRIVVWIDLNSSFLLKTGRFFPGHYFSVSGDADPNPAAFIAA